jgi:hypothetical protein
MYTLVVAMPSSGKSPRSITLAVSIFEDSAVYWLAKITRYGLLPKDSPVMDLSIESFTERCAPESIGDNCVGNAPDFGKIIVDGAFDFAVCRNRQLKVTVGHRDVL